MNFLSPDDIFSGGRRKSLCNGALLTLSSQNNADNAASTSPKTKKKRRRGSFNDTTASISKMNGGNTNNTNRRSSLVARWFKHISDAAEQYKPRSKNINHETVDDPAIATLPHSNTRESLEMTPERSVPQAATAIVVTTPLAPIMPLPSTNISIIHDKIVNAPISYSCNDVQLRNARRETTPMSVPAPASSSSVDYYNLNQRSSHNELIPNTGVVNRTMSTRSCGEANNNYSNIGEFAAANGVALRHTQSARQANGSGDESLADSPNKRDSASIVYSNNSNSTRTLMQPPPPLVDPKAIQISISPAHTAQPVLTPAEKLKRLDATIREGLMEKQKIICDMFRLPIEHFNEIVDIAAMPEAPKDSADIALAAYAQVQTLTEVFNEYMQVKSEKEILGVSKTVCNKCYEKQQQNDDRSKFVKDERNSKTMQEKSEKHITENEELPPPLPPPKKQIAQAQQPIPMATMTKLQSPSNLMESDIHEDDDGYCELDELRLPALPHLLKATPANTSLLGKSQVTPSPPPPSLPVKNSFNQATINNNILIIPPIIQGTCTTPELVKRQSIISADSIPEESADEVTNALNDAIDNDGNPKDTKTQDIPIESKENFAETVALIAKETDKNSIANSEDQENKVQSNLVDKAHCIVKHETIDEEAVESEGSITPTEVLKENYGDNVENDNNDDKDEDSVMHTAECETPDSEDIKLSYRCTEEHNETHDAAYTNETSTTTFMSAEPQQKNSKASTTISNNIEMELLHASEHMEINEAYETLSSLQKANAALSMVDSSTQTLPLTTALSLITPNSSTTGFNTISTTTTQNSTTDATEITITSTVANTNTNSTITQNISSNNSNSNNNSNNNTNVNINTSTASTQYGLSRIQQATTNTLGPSVPCNALSSIVNALNAQISLLLPKINERDIERERLRRENLHLRELLNAMHDRLRVESKVKTPSDTSANVKKVVGEIEGFSPVVMKMPTSMPISTSTPTTSITSSMADVTSIQETPEIQQVHETTNINNDNLVATTNTPKSIITATTITKSIEAEN